jgi:hypothetical protein
MNEAEVTANPNVMDYLSFFIMFAAYALFILWYAVVLFWNRKTIHCVDLLTNRQDKISRVALAQLSGIIIASWLPIHMAVTGDLNATVVFACLSYLAAIEAYNKWLAHKEGAGKNAQPTQSAQQP